MFYSDSNVHITIFIVFKQRQEVVEPGASTLLAGAVGILDQLIPWPVWNKTLARRSSVRFRSSFIRLITDIVYSSVWSRWIRFCEPRYWGSWR